MLASMPLTGCATWIPSFLRPASKVQGDHFSGRLSVRVENDSQRSFSAAFELAGTDKEGVLSLSTPLGPQLARASWSPRRVELKTPQRVKEYASLDQLAVEAMGENVPITALFDWLIGRPWPGAPSRTRQQGFELAQVLFYCALGLNRRFAPQQLGQRVQRAVAVIGRAMAAQQPMRRVAYSLGERLDQARLAHSCIAAEQHEVAVALDRTLP